MIQNGTITRGSGGSVGASWPPRYDSHNNRIKGFCPRPIGNPRDAALMFRAVRDTEKANPGSTRTTVRAFVRYGLLEDVRRAVPSYVVEARFDAGNALEGHELVYFGRNAQDRMPELRSFRLELDSVTGMQAIGSVGRRNALERVRAGGYAVSLLNGEGSQEVGRLFELYREAYQEYTFGMTPDTIRGMLENGNIVIAGRDSRGALVSSLIAEHCRLVLEDGRHIHLYELSDYATFRAHRGRGLMTLMQMEAVMRIRELHGREAIIYAEDRAAWIAVNLSSRRAGLDYCGTLPQHCVLVSDRDFGEQGRYENLNVWVHQPR